MRSIATVYLLRTMYPKRFKEDCNMMNIKEYRAPRIELVEVCAEDVIRTSGGFFAEDDAFTIPSAIDDLDINHD